MTQRCGQGRQLRTASSTLLQAPGYLHAVQAGLHHAVLHTASHGCRLLRESSPTTETTSKDVHRAKGGGNREGAAKRKEGLQEGRGETAERGRAHKAQPQMWHCQPRHCSMANSVSSIAESMAGVQMSHYSLLRAASGHTLARGNHSCLHSACWSAAQKLAEVMLQLSQGLPHFCLQNEDLCCRTSAFCRKFYGFTHQLLGLMRLTPDLVSRGRKNSRQCFWQCSSSRGSSGVWGGPTPQETPKAAAAFLPLLGWTLPFLLLRATRSCGASKDAFPKFFFCNPCQPRGWVLPGGLRSQMEHPELPAG